MNPTLQEQPEAFKPYSIRQYALMLGSRIEYIVSHPDEYPDTIEAVEEQIQSVLNDYGNQCFEKGRESERERIIEKVYKHVSNRELPPEKHLYKETVAKWLSPKDTPLETKN